MTRAQMVEALREAHRVMMKGNYADPETPVGVVLNALNGLYHVFTELEKPPSEKPKPRPKKSKRSAKR